MLKRTEAVRLWIKFILLMAAPYRYEVCAIALTLRAGLRKLPVMSSLEPALDAGREHDSPSQRFLRALHEQVQNNNTHRLQRRTHGEDRAADRSGPAELRWFSLEFE